MKTTNVKNQKFTDFREGKYGADKPNSMSQIDHKQLADAADSAAKLTRVVATIAIAGAAVFAPTGLSVVGIALGLVSTPLIVTAAPILVGIAAGAAAVSAAASLYSKMKQKNGTF